MHPAFRKHVSPDPAKLRYHLALDGFDQLCPDGQTIDADRFATITTVAQETAAAGRGPGNDTLCLYLFMPDRHFTEIDAGSVLQAFDMLPPGLSTRAYWCAPRIGGEKHGQDKFRAITLDTASNLLKDDLQLFFVTAEMVKWSKERSGDKLRDFYTRTLDLRARRVGSKPASYPVSLTEFMEAEQPPIWATPRIALDGITLLRFEGTTAQPQQTFYRVASK
jgi:hypothetical protein